MCDSYKHRRQLIVWSQSRSRSANPDLPATHPHMNDRNSTVLGRSLITAELTSCAGVCVCVCVCVCEDVCVSVFLKACIISLRWLKLSVENESVRRGPDLSFNSLVGHGKRRTASSAATREKHEDGIEDVVWHPLNRPRRKLPIRIDVEWARKAKSDVSTTCCVCDPQLGDLEKTQLAAVSG